MEENQCLIQYSPFDARNFFSGIGTSLIVAFVADLMHSSVHVGTNLTRVCCLTTFAVIISSFTK